MDISTVERHTSVVQQELYFLVAKFLLESPFKNAGQALIQDLERSGHLPDRIDWEGERHTQGFNELAAKYRHIGPNHLLQICSRLPALLENDAALLPTVSGIATLLGSGRQSLLRTVESISRPKSLSEYCVRLHGSPMTDAVNRKKNNNIVNVLYGRQSAGSIIRKQAIPTSFYSKITLLRQTLGHLSAVYCVLFDRSGKHIITGADDLLVKLWSAIDGRLLTTFRGASAEITDIAINLENTMIAAGSIDRVLRVWDLHNSSVIAVLCAHGGMITSVNFCPNPRSDFKFLVTTSTDGSVAFWQYSQPRGQKPIFQTKPTQLYEKIRPGQAQMICASFSPGGMFLAAGSADHHVRVYMMDEGVPKRILETESHTDTVDSIQWAHSGLKFVSGSKDGTALLWRFETQQWKFEKLNMSDRFASCPPPDASIDLKKGYKVTMVSWDRSDDWVVTAVNDHTIKVWNSKTAKLHKVLRGHTDELYVLESHPKDQHVLLSAGHDGNIFLWDIVKGEKLGSFMNTIEGQGHGGIFDAKWSPDGTMIAATDSHGHMLMFGLGSGHKRLKEMPKELFFHTDYRPLVRDNNYYVLDEQTQLAPYLMPPPFLVDVDGNPYPPSMQRLVPGRELCANEQLVPDIGEAEPRSEIDRLIEALAHRHGNEPNEPNQADEAEVDDENDQNQQNRIQAPVQRPAVPIIDQNISLPERLRTYVKSLKHSTLHMMKQVVYYAGIAEKDCYHREMKKRPLMISTGNASCSALIGPPKKYGRGARKRRMPGENQQQQQQQQEGGSASTSGAVISTNRTSARVSTRPRHLLEDEEGISSSSESSSSDDSTAMEVNFSSSQASSSSNSDSSDYSDWIDVEDQQRLEPPKRSKRKPVERSTFSPIDTDSNKKRGGPKGIKKIPLLPNGEIPDEYKPPEWLSEVIPKKAPYYPQMGDEVVYFRQGHERYFEHVKNKKLYQLTGKFEPWQQLELREHEFCKVIGIKYEIRPPRLCCLKLALMTDNGSMTDKHFTIKYHDVPDVLDFLVLKQTFDTAISRNWGPGDRFRCMIDDKWWIGQIESHQALHEEFPTSLFMCFKVRWDNSEYEFMSPWDLEPIDEERVPDEIGGSVPVLPEEIQAILYRPKSEEWPRGDREGSCRRIVAGLEQVMGLAIADPFLTPVDLNSYPTYAFVVEYPIDVSTIKSRFENHFYRRVTSAQFDVRYLATNAEKFNEKHSNIVKHARIVTDLCLRILRDHNDVDVPAAYHQLLDTYQSSESEDESQPRPSTSRAAESTTRRTNGARRSKRLVPLSGDWRMKCRELLQVVINSPDSQPFREPVDLVEHPDYLQIIDTPMDLQTVKEELLSGNYETPMDFSKDMKLIFQNSRSYNTNQRSRIYAMTLRLAELFEENIRQVISSFKSSSKKRNSASKKKESPKSSNNNRRSSRRNNGNAPSSNQSQNHHSESNDDDDDDDDDDDEQKKDCKKSKINGRTRARNHQQSNGVSSSQPAGSSRSLRNTRLPSTGEEESESSESSSENTSEASDESSGIPLAELGKNANKVAHSKPKKNKKQAVSSSSQNNTASRRSKRERRRMESEEDAEESEEEEKQNSDEEESKSSRRSRAAAAKRSQTTTDDDQKSQGGGSDEPRRRRQTRRPKRYESDTSFHVERTSNRRRTAESDDSERPRATRESTRKKFREWAVTSDDETNDNGSLEEKPQTSSSRSAQRSPVRRSSRKKKIISDSDQSEHDKKSLPSRSTRARVSQSQEDESNESEHQNDRPSTSSSARQRVSRLTNGSSTASQPSTSSMHVSRTTRSAYQQIQAARNDHNYGEQSQSSSSQQPSQQQQPSQSQPVRETRSAIVSRHQRNADELDRSNLAETISNNRLLRLRSANQRTAPSSNFEALNGIRRTSRVRTTHNYFEDDNEAEEEEPVVQQVQNRLERRVARRQERNRSQERKNQHNTEESDSYSEEDKTPLKQVASSSKRAQNTRNGSSNAVNRIKRSLYSDDANSDQAGPSTRNTRSLKRPHYNESQDSDEEKNQRDTRRTKRRMVSNESESSNNDNVDNNDDEEDEDEDGGPSVSQRGRIRKPTAKAKGLH